MTVRKSQDVMKEAIEKGEVVHHTEPIRRPDKEEGYGPPEEQGDNGAKERERVFAEVEEEQRNRPPPKETPEEYRKRKTQETREKAQRVARKTREQDDEERAVKFFKELLAKYNAAVVTSEELENVNIEPRAKLLGEWLREGDLGFIYGERGSGKTWLVAGIATSVSAGTNLDTWESHGLFPVLYVDGEMPIDLTRDRLKGLSPKNKNLSILHHEHLYNLSGDSMNIADQMTQKVILEICTIKKIKLLILDNLSCLASGVKENDADEWEKLLNWLLDLRRRRIAVVIVHHAGTSGRMRGTTKREDSAAWVIKVTENNKNEPSESIARFETSFEKRPRGSTVFEWNRGWVFKTEVPGDVSIGCEEVSFDGKVLQLIQAGLTSPTDISLELNCAKSTVCKAAKRLENQNLIEKKGGNRFTKYEPRGFMKT
jgi:AAA domain